ncbi:MAG: hypothetical protein HYV02_00560 [Deltaproteobacteria bacterium]|nr:hypothetical protein [Deltaproteobacteria bacterium]
MLPITIVMGIVSSTRHLLVIALLLSAVACGDGSPLAQGPCALGQSYLGGFCTTVGNITALQQPTAQQEALLGVVAALGPSRIQAIAALGTSRADIPPAPCDPDGDGDLANNIEDAALRSAISAALGGNQINIPLAQASALSILETPKTSSAETITSLVGLHCFPSLEKLGINGHKVTDLAPLASLPKLRTIALIGNPVTTLQPLVTLAKAHAHPESMTIHLGKIGALSRHVHLLRSLGVMVCTTAGDTVICK